MMQRKYTKQIGGIVPSFQNMFVMWMKKKRRTKMRLRFVLEVSNAFHKTTLIDIYFFMVLYLFKNCVQFHPFIFINLLNKTKSNDYNMSQRNILSNNQLKYFYESRKKFDKVITDIMGPDVHLHDISAESDDIEGMLVEQNKFNKRQSEQPSHKKIKFDEVYSTLDNLSKNQKLHKENIGLQEKVRTIQNDNKQFKYKAQLWEKVKGYIEGNVGKYLNLRALTYGSSDVVILEQFLLKVDQLIGENKSKLSENRKKKEEEYLNELLNESKKKNSQYMSEIYKLKFDNEKLEKENQLLTEKTNILLENRKQRYDEIKSGIGEKFAAIQIELQEKKKQSDQLRQKLNKFERDSILNNSFLQKKRKSISFGENQKIQQSLMNEKEEIRRVREQNRSLYEEVKKLKKSNTKLKKIISIAKNLNDEFLLKIQSSINVENKDYLSRSPCKDYYDRSVNKSKNSFHLKNSQFKFIKEKVGNSRSCKKQILRSHDSNL